MKLGAPGTSDQYLYMTQQMGTKWATVLPHNAVCIFSKMRHCVSLLFCKVCPGICLKTATCEISFLSIQIVLCRSFMWNFVVAVSYVMQLQGWVKWEINMLTKNLYEPNWHLTQVKHDAWFTFWINFRVKTGSYHTDKWDILFLLNLTSSTVIYLLYADTFILFTPNVIFIDLYW